MNDTIAPPPSKVWAIDTIDTIRRAINERDGVVKRESIDELSGIYSDVLLIEIQKLRENIQKEFYGDGSNKSITDLIQDICAIYNISPEQLEMRTRRRDILEPRQLFHWALKNRIVRNSLTLTQIGQFTGRQDHATVLHSCKTVDNRIQTEREFREMVMKLCNGFGMRTFWDGNGIQLERVI